MPLVKRKVDDILASMKNERGQSIWIHAVNGSKTPALYIGITYSSKASADGDLAQAKQDYEFPELEAREIKPGQEYERASMSVESLH